MKSSVEQKRMAGEGSFKQFPEFSKLTINDRGRYERLIEHLPPIGDAQFYSLMVRWNAGDVPTVAIMSDNLVVSYWMPGNDRSSGISLLGDQEVDASICQIFDWQRSVGQQPRLVHVPEAVIVSIKHHELFVFEGERDFDEYIVRLDRLADVKTLPGLFRVRIKQFMRRNKSRIVSVRSVDLKTLEARRAFLGIAQSWNGKGFINSAAKHVNDMIELAILSAPDLGLSALGLYIDDELAGFIMYYLPDDDDTIIITHSLVDTTRPYVYDYMIHAFSRWLLEHGVNFANLDSDLGLPVLRGVKLALGPVNYYRKYTVRPAE